MLKYFKENAEMNKINEWVYIISKHPSFGINYQ